MEISPLLLLRMTLASFFFGLFAGLVGDFHSFIRSFLGVEVPVAGVSEWLGERGFTGLSHMAPSVGACKRRAASVLRFFQDFIWFSLLGVGMCLILYGYNSGRFRMLVPLAALFGVFLYRLLLHPLLLPILSVMALLFRRVISLVLHPVFLFLAGIGKFFCFLLEKLKLVLEKRKILRYNKNKKQGLLDEAEQGFLRRRDDHGARKLFYETKIYHGDSR